MSDHNRPTSRWSSSMSVTTRSTGATNQTIPLITVRRKLFRQSANSHKSLAHRTAKSKHDIEELFKLYYSNDIKFDAFQRQIVTGTRIPPVRTSPIPNDHSTTSSTNIFNSKHCVSREQMSTADGDGNEATKRPGQIRTDNNLIINPSMPPLQLSPSPLGVIAAGRNISEISASTQENELCESPLVKSVTLLGNIIPNEFHENMNSKRSKSNISQRPVSSRSPLFPVPPSSLLIPNDNNRKDPTGLSNSSCSTLNPSQQQNRPTGVTGSAVRVRQRSPTKQSLSQQRTKSNTTILSSQQLPTKTRSPSVCSPLSIQPDMPELPVFIGSPRVVSIPSRCSRYVLVTFPEVPLRYNAPSYVERLLLPERFPTLFQNIVHSYDQHLHNAHHHHQNPK